MGGVDIVSRSFFAFVDVFFPILLILLLHCLLLQNFRRPVSRSFLVFLSTYFLSFGLQTFRLRVVLLVPSSCSLFPILFAIFMLFSTLFGFDHFFST